MSTVHSLEDTLRRHDAAVYRWLGGLTVDYGINPDLNELVTIDRDNLPILRVMAGPDRVVAQVVDRLVQQGWIAGNDPTLQAANAETLRAYAEKNFAVLPLPILAIQRSDPVASLPDSGVPKVFRRQSFSQVDQTWEQHQWPGAYETTYAVTFWSLKRYTENYFREWLYSQLGRRGVEEQAVLIPVVHEEPWGTIQQRLIFEGSSDLSEFEGENRSRVLRFEYTFRLRTWHFRQPVSTTSYVHDLALRETSVGSGFDSVDAPSANPSVAPVSLNMFSVYMTSNLIPKQWPKIGAAKVSASHAAAPQSGLRIVVDDTDDEVLLSNRAVPPDANGRAILSLAFDYIASAPARILTASRDPSVEPVSWVTNREFDLTATPSWAGTWKKVQFFTLIEHPIFSTTVQGLGSPAIVHVRNVSLVHVRTLDRVDPTSSTPGGGGTIHAFTGLGTGAYLVVVAFGAGATAGSIDVDGTLYPVSAANSVGFVGIFTPVAGAASVTVPSALPTDDVYLQPYLGSWRGTDV